MSAASILTDVPRKAGLTDDQAESLKDWLKPVCDERFGGNQTALARALGIPQSQVNHILRGKKGNRGAGVSTLVRIRSYLGVSLDDLLGLRPLGHRPVALLPPSSSPATPPPTSELASAIVQGFEDVKRLLREEAAARQQQEARAERRR